MHHRVCMVHVRRRTARLFKTHSAAIAPGARARVAATNRPSAAPWKPKEMGTAMTT